MKEKYFSIGAALLHHSRRGVLRRLKRRLVRKRERNLSDNFKCTRFIVHIKLINQNYNFTHPFLCIQK
jgi:hypothetical protein